MRIKKLLLVFLLIPLFLVLTLAVYSLFKHFSSEPSDTDELSGVSEPDYSVPIIGPDAGESGNDFDNTFRSLTISHTDPDIVYIGNEGNGIFRTMDGGETWEWLRNGLKYVEDRYPEVYDMVIDVNDESVVLAGTTNGPSPIYTSEYEEPITAGIYRSEDGGDSWTQYLSGLPNSAVVSLVQVPGVEDTYVLGLDGLRSSRDNYRHLESYGGLYISQDGGMSWEETNIPEEGIQNRFAKLKVRGSPTKQVLFTSGVKWTEVEGSSHSSPDVENSIGLLKSDDLGETWTRINPAPDAFVLYFDVSSNGKTIYAGDLNEGTTYLSSDSGDTWQEISFGGFGPVKFFPDNDRKLLYAAGNDLYVTYDGFESSKKVLSSDAPFNDIEFFESNSEIVYVSGAGFIVYRSEDGGESFDKVGDLREYIDAQ